jgi:hypothetical protein
MTLFLIGFEAQHSGPHAPGRLGDRCERPLGFWGFQAGRVALVSRPSLVGITSEA